MEDRKYTIIISVSAKDLVLQVNKALAEGWVPVSGAIPFETKSGEINWTQTIVKQG